MGVASEVLGRVVGLPRPATRLVRVHRDIDVPMRDGVLLRADHYEPAVRPAPTVLIRTPYGRRGGVGVVARTAAEQGFQVVVQCCRGTFDSGGGFVPMRHETDDGLDTLAWLREQRWYDGQLCTFGPSYVGFTQWAIAADAGPELKAMATVVTASQFRESTYAGGAFSLDTVLTWAELLAAQNTPPVRRQLELWRGQRALNAGLAHLPLSEADTVATGAEVAFVREWLAHVEPGDPYWDTLGHGHRIADVTAAVLMVGGWYDIFLPWQLADHAALRRAGVDTRLVIGPWTHGSAGLYLTSLREAMDWFARHTTGGQHVQALSPSPVRVHIGGADQWCDLPGWPPAAEPWRWYLAAGGRLERQDAGSVPAGDDAARDGGTAEGDPLRYDPRDPTPSLGGPLLMANRAGRRDNRALEARGDVLVYSTAPLSTPVEIAGPVEADLYLRSDLAHFDVFVRLCDVDTAGRSWNVCDGLHRVAAPVEAAGADGVYRVRVELWPTAYRFAPGHRIRVQVSGGAHPRYARNPGSGEPLASATRLVAGERHILRSGPYRSSIMLPLVGILHGATAA